MKVICLIGATAAGKTALALEAFERFNLHLISVDAAQVYKGMDIGTAKLTKAELQRYPHALIDILQPEENYSAAEFVKDAKAEIAKASELNKTPCLVGGTMLYFQALFGGLSDLPSSTAESRAVIEQRFNVDKGKSLYEELTKLDPQTAAKVAPQDKQRIIRFTELIYLTGKTPTQLFLEQEKQKPNWEVLALGLDMERSVLHNRIAQRLEIMLKAGFLEEVRELKKRPNLTAQSVAMRSVGYRQFWQHLEGEISYPEAVEKTLYATRQLAKRQCTWLNNGLKKVLPIIIKNPISEQKEIWEELESFLA